MPWRIRSSQSVGDDRFLSARASVRGCAADSERAGNVFRRQERRSLFGNGRLGWNAVGRSDLAGRYFFKQSEISSGAGGGGMESKAVSRLLFKDEVGDGRLEIPIDHRQRSQIERGVRDHQHRKLAGYREDACENETGDDGLLGAGKSLGWIVRGTKQCGGEQHDEYLGPRARPEKFAEPFEHPSAEKSFLPETGVDNQNEKHSRERSRVSGQEVIRLIDRRRAEKRHHHRFHQKFKRNTESDADNDCSRPTLRSHVTDLAPWRAR